MGMNSSVEELMTLQETISQTLQPTQRTPANEESKDNMTINVEISLRNLHIDPMERFMGEFVGTTTELSGLFKIHASNVVDGKSEGKLNLFSLDFTTDEQISLWVNRMEETWKRISVPT